MYAHPQQGKDNETVQELRREAGRWVRERREAARLSQRELAAAVGLEYYTFISQIESGRGRIPPDRYEAYARALKIDVRVFAKTLMRYYDPVTYGILFAEEDRKPRAEDESPNALQERLAKLESMVAKLAAR
ncbi:transcriptional regulator [Devosia pacifica]|uniref:Transcriptional regulator n=1 Tax=Devosia pacifica TaxID=1335967 RepID=A0A918S148_9HYPH|nr:helix-turn-helix transcriptional regulator [Devosia pacifica]GHA18353.1 transcriptional regulator [Devosia pacifica]